MKLVAAAAFAVLALALASSQSYAEQSTNPVSHNSRETMMLPAKHNQSPYDFNHMAAGSDKSDELGVPYYNQKDM